MHHHTQHRRWTLSFVVAILALAIAPPALADYVGPNRTVTETDTSCEVVLYKCQLVTAKNIWKYKSENSWSCSNESKPWQAYPSNSPPCNDAQHDNGYKYWEREESTHTETITYPPATVNSSLQNCTLQNGWCTTVPQLFLSGSEPVAGYSIFAIEGSLNGQTFACMSSTCNVPLNQGNNNFAYWALSSFLDSSEMGTFTAKVDSQLPNITGTLSGATGSNGWYVSPVSLNNSASDATSGLASFTCSLDGVALGSCNTISVNSDGPHTLVLTARDNAGHTRTVTQNASIDTQNPALSASISGTSGSNDWYTTALLNASASDPSPGSGLSVLEYKLDDSGWKTFPGSGALDLVDGKHTVELRAVDGAGRTVSSSKSFWLDTAAPDVTLDSAGTIGQNEWYITSPTLTASADDETSGMDILEYSLDNGGWQAYTTSLTLDDGTHSVSIWAQDAAGLVTQIDRTYQVDTRLPQIAGSLSGTPGLNGWYVSPVILSVAASDPLPGSGMDAFTYVLDGIPETSYTDPIPLPDGQHTVQFIARDKAGLSYSIEQNIKVDATQPSLQVATTPPAWVKGALSLNGTASDDGSGLSKVEVSTNDGQTWLNVIGTDANTWNYTWNTIESANGLHQILLRVTDLAGLTTQQTLNVGVDNHAPEIILPESWFQWDTITLDILDNHSGLSEASVEITDPNGRLPKRVIPLDPGQFPLRFKWDRRFGDNTVAEPGTYDVNVIASDHLNNTTTRNASIKILLDILPAGPTSTAQPYRVEPTQTPIYTATITPSPITTQTAIVSMFGVIEPTTPVTPTLQTLATATPRATPTQASVLDWLQSIFAPNADPESTIEIGSLGESRESAQPTETDSNTVLWGTAATAAIAAATAYAQEEKRRREEEKARQAQLEEDAEERRKKAKKRKLAKIEAQRAQERAWEEAREEARLEQEKLEESRRAATLDRYNERMERIEDPEAINWVASQAAVRQRYEEKKKTDELQAGLEAYYNGRKQGEQEALKTDPNWWEKTKSFVNDNIIQPVDTYVYQPYIKPVVDKVDETVTQVVTWVDENIYQTHIKPTVERNKEFITNEFTWINEHIYQPVVKPIGEKISDAATKVTTWANENVYQPYIKPAVEKVTQNVSNDIKWLNETIYQPYIQPVVEVINEKVYQPYVKPVVEKINETVTEAVSWVDKNIYQPILEPVVSDINQYIYQPLAKDVTDWWDEYGEWVHGALDAAGFIPGLGEIADGINGLVYLAEGRYLEASLSAISMIPLLGDAGKIGKWVDTAVSTVAKQVAGEALEKAAKELLEEGAEKVVKESDEWVHTALDAVGLIPGASPLTKKVDTLIYLTEGRFLDATTSVLSMTPVVGELVPLGEKILKASWDRVVKQAAEEMREKLIKETGEELAERITKETIEQGTEKVLKEIGEEVAENTTKGVLEETAENTVSKVQKEDAFIAKVPSEDVEWDTTATQDAAVEEIVQSIPEQFDSETTRRVLNDVVDGKVTKLPADISEKLTTESASELAAKISEELGGKKVWVSAKTGSIYVSSPPAEGFLLAEQLSKTDLTKTDEVEKILHRVAELTSRGSGDHVVLGPFKPNGTFIQEALDTDGVFWDVGDELWEALEKTGIDMFNANDQFIRVHIENGIDRFDVIDTNVNEVLNNFNNDAPKDWTNIKYTEKEILDLASMPDIPYQLVENSWVKVDLINNTN